MQARTFSMICVATLTFGAVTAAAEDACSLLAQADIVKATGIAVGEERTGAAIPGTLGRCTWLAADNTRVIVTLADASHMRTTVTVQLESGGTPVTGIGSKAVVTPGAAFTGGGYIINVLDGKGGFGVSILGKAGTQDRVVALAKLVESRR